MVLQKRQLPFLDSLAGMSRARHQKYLTFLIHNDKFPPRLLLYPGPITTL